MSSVIFYLYTEFRVVEPETETEHDAVVPETKEQTDGESGAGEDGAATSFQVEEAGSNEAPADTEILVRDSSILCWLSYLVYYFITGLLWGQTSWLTTVADANYVCGS